MFYPPEVEAARAQVFQLIGRNVLRFQRIELALKSMVTGSRISIISGESPTDYERRKQATGKKTLGLVAGQFFEEVVSDQPPAEGSTFSREEDKARAAGKAHIGFSYKIHLPPDEHLLWKIRLEKLIGERNALVHTSLLRMDLETMEGCQHALASLEDQAARVLAEIEHLKPISLSVEDSKEALRERLSNDPFWQSLRPSK